MNRKLLLAATTAAVLSFPTIAHAENFSGPYVGVDAGFDNFEIKADDLEIAGGEVSADGLSANGIAGGFHAGWDFDLGGAFAGVEAMVGSSDAGLIVSGTDGVDEGRLSIRAKGTYGFAGRIGAKVGEDTGVYAKVGWINTRIKGRIEENGVSDSASDGQSALLYGAGIQTFISDTISLRGEFTFADYGSADIGDGVKVDNSSIRVGISYNF
jgi:outer membrane immunogenic protein